MNESIQIAIISAGLAALVNCIFQLANKLIDNKKEKRQSDLAKLDAYNEKKETVYVAAIGRLLQIRRAFDCTRESVMFNKAAREAINKDNLSFVEIAAKLRLYSTDKIFNKYHELARYARYAYAPTNGPRLIENSKWAFDMQVTLLARQMQADLGYRNYNNEHDLIMCPECGREHDIVSKCPGCGLTYEDLQKKAQESLEQIQEMQPTEIPETDIAE